MKILWLEFENLETGLRFEKIKFNKDITLLVGLSGAGKTQILNAIKYSISLVAGARTGLSPYWIDMGILIGDDEYEWSYEISKVNEGDWIINPKQGYEFLFESFKCNGKTIFERKNGKVEITGYNKVPQPRKNESLISQYSEDKNIAIFASEMQKLYSDRIGLEFREGIGSDWFRNMKHDISIMLKVRNNVQFSIFSQLPAAFKLYIAKRYFKDIYIKILDAVKELFNEIEDIGVEEDATKDEYIISIQVYGEKILQDNISNGMLKTIYYLVELYTLAENSFVLIDEFENGLGVNCIDLLSEFMFSERNDLQFIITSHHPKIINAINKYKWKIIERTGQVVKNYDSIDFGIGNSQHDAYFNLVNRWEFEGKI